jgi:hypothetical protein
MIYFLQEESAEQYIKIGSTEREPHIRNLELQTGNPYSLHFLKITKGNKLEEQTLHKRFKHLQVFRVGREWFRPEPDLLEYINSLKEEFQLPKVENKCIPERYDATNLTSLHRTDTQEERKLSERTAVSNQKLTVEKKKQILPSRLDMSSQLRRT